MISISNPKMIDERISTLLTKPSVEKDNRISIVESINPEFLITL
jgi:hypothetical protein